MLALDEPTVWDADEDSAAQPPCDPRRPAGGAASYSLQSSLALRGRRHGGEAQRAVSVWALLEARGGAVGLRTTTMRGAQHGWRLLPLQPSAAGLTAAAEATGASWLTDESLHS